MKSSNVQAQAMQVIRTITCEGDGTKDSICRNVFKYWSLDGQLLATFDPCPPNS